MHIATRSGKINITKEKDTKLIAERLSKLINLGIKENLKKQITLVEWPEIVKKLKIKNSISLIFKYNKSYTERYLTIISKNKKIINEFR